MKGRSARRLRSACGDDDDVSRQAHDRGGGGDGADRPPNDETGENVCCHVICGYRATVDCGVSVRIAGLSSWVDGCSPLSDRSRLLVVPSLAGTVVEHRLVLDEEPGHSHLACSCRVVETALAEDKELVLRRAVVAGLEDLGLAGLVEDGSMCVVDSHPRLSFRVVVRSLVAEGLARSLLGCMRPCLAICDFVLDAL